MTKFHLARALGVAFGLTVATTAWAGATDYEFQIVENELQQGDGIVVEVRLVDKRTGQLVPDAVIFAKRIDMAPENMATMTAPLDLLPSSSPWIYRLKTNLSMAGDWQLSLAAKVQSEPETVQSQLLVTAVP